MSYYDYKMVYMDGIWYVFEKKNPTIALFENTSFTECYSFIKAMVDDIEIEL
jgi:hypothetical protein